MKPGFYLKCGMHWTHVAEGFGCEWVTTAVPERAKRYETRAEAEKWKARLESRVYAPRYQIVAVGQPVEVPHAA